MSKGYAIDDSRPTHSLELQRWDTGDTDKLSLFEERETLVLDAVAAGGLGGVGRHG